MSRSYRSGFLVHLFQIKKWMEAHGAKGSMDPITMQLTITCQGKTIVFLGQAIGAGAQGIHYTGQLDESVRAFVGWYPQDVETWDTAKSKLEFKDRAEQLGIPTPLSWIDLAAVDRPFLIKASTSSFGMGLRGPFTAEDAQSGRVELNSGEYAEAFEWGRIGRCWYWGAELCAMELLNMPFVVGDGVTSIETLARRRLLPRAKLPNDLSNILRLQGLMNHDVLAAGKRAVVDYRYLSGMMDDDGQDSNVVTRAEHQLIVSTMKGYGRQLAMLLPREIRANRLFVVDLIVRDDLTPHLLEVNSNSLVHPGAYQTMLSRLFGVDTERI